MFHNERVKPVSAGWDDGRPNTPLLSQEELDSLETKSTGLLPLNKIVDGIRSAQEKRHKLFLVSETNVSEEAERYHGLYAPPYISVERWIKIKPYLFHPLNSIRAALAMAAIRVGNKILLFGRRMGRRA